MVGQRLGEELSQAALKFTGGNCTSLAGKRAVVRDPCWLLLSQLLKSFIKRAICAISLHPQQAHEQPSWPGNGGPPVKEAALIAQRMWDPGAGCLPLPAAPISLLSFPWQRVFRSTQLIWGFSPWAATRLQGTMEDALPERAEKNNLLSQAPSALVANPVNFFSLSPCPPSHPNRAENFM